VSLGEGLEEIGMGEFSECTSLHEILIPPAVKEIRGETFAGCSQLTVVTFGKGLEEIADAFPECSSLHEISIAPRCQGDRKLGIQLVLAADDCESWRGPGGDLDGGIRSM
jgi:hypothetical protein